jgi:peptide/nickel transport system permease protein
LGDGRECKVTQYIIRRLIYGVLLILLLAMILFFALHVLGDPITLMLPEDATEEQYQKALHQYGYDRPVLVQLTDFLNHLAHLDFGESLTYRRSAGALFWERFPKTVALASVVLAIALPVGLLLGILAALWPLSVVDRVASVLSYGGIAMPSFWLALMLIIVFSVRMGLLPTSGFGGFGSWQYYILPATALVARPIGRLAQVTRASIVEERTKPYITVSRAKGLSESRVLFGHTLKNAMNPIITLCGGEIAGIINGSVVIESIFGWPGIGSLTIDAVIARDLYLVETCIIAVGVIVVFINLIVDILYAFCDPRIVY